MNLLLLVVGMALLLTLFAGELRRWELLLALCMPLGVVYVMPYSESLFFLGVAVGMYGLLKRRYGLYFAGFFVAILTRSAGSILVPAWIITDAVVALRNRSGLKAMLREMTAHLLPVVAGVAAVVLFQHFRGAEHWFQFVVAQGEWGKSLSLPSWPLTEWSMESKSVSFMLLYLLFVPAMVWLVAQCRRVDDGDAGGDERYRVRMLSVLYFVGNVLLALLTQHGCVNSLARYLTCTPFFVFLVLDIAGTPLSRWWQAVMAAAIVVAILLGHSMLLHADALGSIIVTLTAVLVFFGRVLPVWLRNVLLGGCIAVNVYWTAYLFNAFISGGWIFT